MRKFRLVAISFCLCLALPSWSITQIDSLGPEFEPTHDFTKFQRNFFEQACDLTPAQKNQMTLGLMSNAVLMSYNKCKVVRTQEGRYSYYGKGDPVPFHGKQGFCETTFDRNRLSVALPKGMVARPGLKPTGNQVACNSIVRLTDLKTKKVIYAQVTDTGGFKKNIVDVSYNASVALGYKENKDEPRLRMEFCEKAK